MFDREDVPHLAEGAHLWLAFPDERHSTAALDRQDVLAPEDRERMQRFLFDRELRLYAVSHALLRLTLSRYLPVAPADWRFRRQRHGKPEIHDCGAPPLRFSLSHTHGLVAVLVTASVECGVDVEHTDRLRNIETIARRVLSALEAAELSALPQQERRYRFFRLWTLKEAYLKCRGLGLALPLNQISFSSLDSDAPHVSFGADIADDSNAWQFRCARPSPCHQAAVALRTDGCDPLPITSFVVGPDLASWTLASL